MNVPLLDLKAQLKSIEAEMKQAVNEVIDSCGYIMGPKVEALERQVAEYSGTRFAVGVSSGTDALLVSLMALGVGPGDIVLTTPYSFFATAGAIARVHAQAAFVDIDPVTYNIDPAQIFDWFAINPQHVSRVKAIIPVHLYGQCADMDPILDAAAVYNIPVIEDAAQAIGATYPSREGVKKAGSMGATGCFSFFPSKNLGGIGDGGMVVTNNEALNHTIFMMRNHGADPKTRYYHAMIGGNFRLDALQAVALSVKLPLLESWHEARRSHAAYYDEHMPEYIQTPTTAYGREHHIYNQYIIRVPDRRDEFCAFLSKNNIGNAIYYPVPFHLQECFKDLGYKKGDFPNSEAAAAQTVALPVYPELTQEMQDYVIAKTCEFYG